MPTTYSPLRYPGGKSQLAPLVIEVMRANGLLYGEYVEPFAGGCGIACKLLLDGYVSHVHINDLDPAIYAFWWAILNETEKFCRKIELLDITLKEWKKQRDIQNKAEMMSCFELGFSTFFLNRTNHSGIINGGVIGGLAQDGNYLLDCRFNKKDLIKKIQRLAARASQITLTNLDAKVFLRKINKRSSVKILVNIDPPYYLKGPGLYKSSFKPKDHRLLANAVGKISPFWMVTYDDTPETRALYAGYPSFSQSLNYSAQIKRVGVELLVLDPRMTIPESLRTPNLVSNG